MKKKELVQNIVENSLLTKKDVDEIVTNVFEEISKALASGESVDVFGFGKFEVTERKERDGINPATKERIRIKASKNVKFKPAKSLKDKVN